MLVGATRTRDATIAQEAVKCRIDRIVPFDRLGIAVGIVARQNISLGGDVAVIDGWHDVAFDDIPMGMIRAVVPK
ncbi:hypothetical protein DA70_09715 [Pandoraea pnomenusa]|nr:hypothetical protein DA70_09715 [Pandoraea pnomenusa]